ncbi:lysozyme (plasmid) [Pantoea stewartii subsp. stewartii DC283]|uniref:Lysozyme n=2 Tax=Pantoea stewartii TaxID=66269 RepID=H3RLK5_PANSE|nr:lysozyme [Pantoea stewartii subsp. stewartii DC283]EHT97718.1 phage lysozyme [Pantoea stewartii subsp. stewartii DC283]KAB0554025.1 lysozyme [Pantoea stewartii subsp. stewartii]
MRKVLAAGGAGALAIAIALLGGHDGVEGRRYDPYQDIGGVWTVCDGITGPDVKQGHHYTDAQCDVLLEKHLAPVKRAVDSAVKVPLDDYTRASLYSFAYNVGTGAFQRSSLLRHLNSGDTRQACNDMRQWVYVNGQRKRGLVYRRYIDHTVCMMGAK